MSEVTKPAFLTPEQRGEPLSYAELRPLADIDWASMAVHVTFRPLMGDNASLTAVFEKRATFDYRRIPSLQFISSELHEHIAFWKGLAPDVPRPLWLFSCTLEKEYDFVCMSPALQYPGALDPRCELHVCDTNYWKDKV